DVLVGAADLIKRSPVAVVIDHYGVYGTLPPNSAVGQKLIDLLGASHVWMKLSAPYRVGTNPLAIRPDRAWLSAILAAAKDRCIWGSDWPHTPPHEAQQGSHMPAPHRRLDYGQLVDEFVAAVGDKGLVDAIMLDNPSRLYGF